MQNKSNGWLPYVVGITIGLAVVCAAGFAVFAMFFYKPSAPKVPVETTAPAIVTFVTAAPTQPAAQPQTGQRVMNNFGADHVELSTLVSQEDMP